MLINRASSTKAGRVLSIMGMLCSKKEAILVTKYDGQKSVKNHVCSLTGQLSTRLVTKLVFFQSLITKIPLLSTSGLSSSRTFAFGLACMGMPVSAK